MSQVDTCEMAMIFEQTYSSCYRVHFMVQHLWRTKCLNSDNSLTMMLVQSNIHVSVRNHTCIIVSINDQVLDSLTLMIIEV